MHTIDHRVLVIECDAGFRLLSFALTLVLYVSDAIIEPDRTGFGVSVLGEMVTSQTATVRRVHRVGSLALLRPKAK